MVNFDEHAQNYRESLRSSLGPFGKNEAFFDLYKVYCIKNWVANDNRAYDVLDYGCGIGKLAGLLAKDLRQSNVYGYDTSGKSLSVAKEENAGLKNVYFINDLSGAQRYDFIVVSNVFHHIKPDEHADTLLKIKGFLKPGGKIVIFEHNPLNPLTRYIVSKCPFDADAKLVWRHEFTRLAAACGLEVELKRYILFFPWSSKLFRDLEYLLGHVPLGAQYMLLLTHK